MAFESRLQTSRAVNHTNAYPLSCMKSTVHPATLMNSEYSSTPAATARSLADWNSGCSRISEPSSPSPRNLAMSSSISFSIVEAVEVLEGVISEIMSCGPLNVDFGASVEDNGIG